MVGKCLQASSIWPNILRISGSLSKPKTRETDKMLLKSLFIQWPVESDAHKQFDFRRNENIAENEVVRLPVKYENDERWVGKCPYGQTQIYRKWLAARRIWRKRKSQCRKTEMRSIQHWALCTAEPHSNAPTHTHTQHSTHTHITQIKNQAQPFMY